MALRASLPNLEQGPDARAISRYGVRTDIDAPAVRIRVRASAVGRTGRRRNPTLHRCIMRVQCRITLR